MSAAALAAGAMAVESQNIVGYDTQTLVGNNGFTWVLSNFKQISNNLANQTLESFIIPTKESFGSGDSIVLQIWASDGSLQGEYSFVDEANAANYGLTSTGWYPLEKMQSWMATDEDLSNDTIIPFGAGVILQSGEADTTLKFAGELVTNLTFTINGNNDFTWTGNATPVDLKLGDFQIPTDESFGSGDSIVLQIWASDGGLEGEYSFVDEANAANYGLASTGWYPLEKMQSWMATDEDCANESVTIPSGKMVIIQSGEADTTLTLPNPLTYSAN